MKEHKATFDRIMAYLKKRMDFDMIKEELNVTEVELIGLIGLMKQSGYLVDYYDGQILKFKAPRKNTQTYEIPQTASEFSFLAIADTHLASKFDRTDILNYIYWKAERLGIKMVFHAGDFTDGKSNRAEHMYELKELSLEGQVQYCVENYPHYSGVTYVISGNHDDWWYKAAGTDIIKQIALQRKDLIYLGPDVGQVKIGEVVIRMFHGNGNVSSNKFGKMVKYLEQIPQSERPDIFLTGHIHEAFYILKDGTHCFQVGSLENLTPFGRSLGITGELSCWWVNVKLNDKGKIANITMQLEKFDQKKRIKIKK